MTEPSHGAASMDWNSTRASRRLEGLTSSLSGQSRGTVKVGEPGLRLGRSSTEVRRRPLLFALVGVSRWCQPPHAGLTAHAALLLGGKNYVSSARVPLRIVQLPPALAIVAVPRCA
jgi:hypothetical protein